MIHHASKILVSYEASGTSSRSESGYEGKGDDVRSTPGIHPRIERPMLIRKSALHPLLKKTARGGRKTARK
jgi:hypothetical protein